MPTSVYAPEVADSIDAFRRDAADRSTSTVQVDGRPVTIPHPFPSPEDWRDNCIYFILTDRFNNPGAAPKSQWDARCGSWQGGTFEGIRRQLKYIKDLGAGAIWLSPIFKTDPLPDRDFTYPAYGAQDFLSVDGRFASDGKSATAEKDLVALIDEAHARGLHVILDIVLNHVARVFDYFRNGMVVESFCDPGLLFSPPVHSVPSIRFLDHNGDACPAWQDGVPPGQAMLPDDAVFPTDLRRADFFRRRGSKIGSDQRVYCNPASGCKENGFIPGDFETMRQLALEYTIENGSPGQQAIRQQYGRMPVLGILIRIYQYLIARYDFDGFRIDTAKFITPEAAQIFGNAIREFALLSGKKNFFIFGELWVGSEETIANFVGRNSSTIEGYGIDASLDFPLFYALCNAANGADCVGKIQGVFEARKKVEADLLSSHADASRYFVTFIDNHDQYRRFNDPGKPAERVTLALATLFSLQGIPCVYYGTEQGLDGTKKPDGSPDLEAEAYESVREALWGKQNAFNTNSDFYKQIQAIARVRDSEPALRYGRQYFREVSEGGNFGYSFGAGGIIAFSRILGDREVLVVADTAYDKPFQGAVTVDRDLARQVQKMQIRYSNCGSSGQCSVRIHSGIRAAADVKLQPMEVQILTPA